MGLKLATTDLLIVVIAAAAVLFICSGWLRQRPPPDALSAVPKTPVRGDDLAVWPFAPMPFMTASEVRFFSRLQDALPEYLIFAQVQLSRLIECTDSEDQKFWFNRINRMSADYVIVQTDAQQVLLVIELDDWTHDSAERRRADAKKDKALKSAGLPVLRVDGRKMPDAKQLRRVVLAKVKT